MPTTAAAIQRATHALMGLMVVLVILVALVIGTGVVNRSDQRAACMRATQDRYEDAITLRAQAAGDETIAADPEQPPRTRDARRMQAAQERATAASKSSRTRPTAGERREFCHHAFPLLPLP